MKYKITWVRMPYGALDCRQPNSHLMQAVWKLVREINSTGQTLKNSKGIGEVMKPLNRSEGLELGRKLGFSSVENLRSVRVYGIFIHFSCTYLNRLGTQTLMH